MVTTKRPADCCAPSLSVEPLPAAERDALVAVLRALGEPMRLEIFRLIAAQETPLCVCDVVERFPLQQPTISHHLQGAAGSAARHGFAAGKVGLLTAPTARDWPCSRKQQPC